MLMIDWRDAIFYLFTTAALIQLFYYGWFFSRLAFYRKKEKGSQRQHPVSVVICTTIPQQQRSDCS
jgi:heme/copper-type cytochrome/quinol oxidase subunit 2